jgi:hypothetical protein
LPIAYAAAARKKPSRLTLTPARHCSPKANSRRREAAAVSSKAQLSSVAGGREGKARRRGGGSGRSLGKIRKDFFKRDLM